MISKRLQTSLFPNPSMKVREEKGRQVFHSVDDDPFFQVTTESKIIKAGWYIINYEFKLEAGKIILPKIYFDFGDGFSEQFHWKLFYSNDEIFGLVKIPWNCYRLRFDISEKDIEFEPIRFAIKRVNKVHGVLHLISILDKLGVKKLNFFRELIGKSNNKERKKLLRSISDGSYLSLSYQQIPVAGRERNGTNESMAELQLHSVVNPAKFEALSGNWKKINDTRDYDPTAMFDRRQVDIIMPVYNGVEYLAKLLPQIIAHSDLPYKLYIIDDCSPDTTVYPYLDSLQKKYLNILVLRNDTNLGFTRTVNKLLRLCESEIIVLLNSDIEIPVNWLSRLVGPMQKDKRIGTITPISNCATICSFPNMGDNELLQGLSVEEINKGFEDTGSYYEDIPTGVGFCMVINKKMIDKIGLLNEQVFPRGYGEEVDLCFRARKNGFRNVLNMSLFVYHKHGGSFSSAEKIKLMAENQRKLEEIHPDFTPVLQDYFSRNTFILFKIVFLLKLIRKQQKSIVLFLDHNLGGGTNQYSKNYQEEYAAKVFVNGHYINPNQNQGKQILFSISYKNHHLKFLSDDLGSLLNLLAHYDVVLDEIIVNNVVSYSEVLQLTDDIISYKRKYGKQTFLKVLCHDFYYICPNFLLFKNNSEFCGIPEDLSVCKSCLNDLSSSIDTKLIPTDFKSLPQWRENWMRLLNDCADQVVMFSESTKELFLKVYPEIASKSIVKPHVLKNFKKFPGKTYNIGILGNIHSVAKGAKFVHELANRIAAQQSPRVRLINFGGIHPLYDHQIIVKDGPYNYANLHYRLLANKIDVILIPSVCSETFSFTTREAIETGIPTASFRLGGQYDQLKKYSKGIAIRDFKPESFVQAVEEYFKE